VGELQHKVLEALFPLIIDPVSILEGDWFLIPDKSTGIREKYELSAHPVFIPDGGVQNPYGLVDVWIRSASMTGEMPDWLLHRAHFHDRNSNCPLKLDGAIGIAKPKRIGGYNFRRIERICHESDKVWLNSFYSCREMCQRNK
jgi:hypothetical protein